MVLACDGWVRSLLCCAQIPFVMFQVVSTMISSRRHRHGREAHMVPWMSFGSGHRRDRGKWWKTKWRCLGGIEFVRLEIDYILGT
ncbi:hypothetical protein F5X96DRAFT_615304 [Biscogniauxia mediterranea]|nr:hypothetical protein F5X96DRAFT_615304 [Biscogniauxia mediterranea]